MKIKDIVLVAACTFLVIIGAYISLPIGPVPIVLTNFFIVLIALLLGWKKALITVVTYIVLGAIGLPVFSNGKAGMAHLFGLTGGFLFAFVPLAVISGLGQNRHWIIRAVLAIAGSVLVYLIGVPWAMNYYNNIVAPASGKAAWDLATTLKYTTIPFLIPGLVKVILAVFLSVILEPVLKPFLKGRDE